MSYKIKTLIVFDTNSLRSTDNGEIAYNFFAFGKPFQMIEDFIKEKNLVADIHIAVPSWVIEELKDQKQRSYLEDVNEYKKLAQRLSGLPHTGEITFPQEEFDCAAYVEEKAKEYLASKQVKILEIKTDIGDGVLRSMMLRVMRAEGKKAPFAHSGKYKDAGFKDNIVWESLMNYESVVDYNKIIFVSKDGDFNEQCKKEFKAKWNRHIAIEKEENNVIAELTKDYENYIEQRVIHDFAQTDYFKEYLNNELSQKSLITIGEIEQPIRSFVVDEYCSVVTKLAPDEDGMESLLVSSKITINYKWDEGTREQEVEALTLIYDEESKEILSTEYDYNLQ